MLTYGETIFPHKTFKKQLSSKRNYCIRKRRKYSKSVWNDFFCPKIKLLNFKRKSLISSLLHSIPQLLMEILEKMHHLDIEYFLFFLMQKLLLQ